jgi:hypothetical protein
MSPCEWQEERNKPGFQTRAITDSTQPKKNQTSRSVPPTPLTLYLRWLHGSPQGPFSLFAAEITGPNEHWAQCSFVNGDTLHCYTFRLNVEVATRRGHMSASHLRRSSCLRPILEDNWVCAEPGGDAVRALRGAPKPAAVGWLKKLFMFIP